LHIANPIPFLSFRERKIGSLLGFGRPCGMQFTLLHCCTPYSAFFQESIVLFLLREPILSTWPFQNMKIAFLFFFLHFLLPPFSCLFDRFRVSDPLSLKGTRWYFFLFLMKQWGPAWAPPWNFGVTFSDFEFTMSVTISHFLQAPLFPPVLSNTYKTVFFFFSLVAEIPSFPLRCYWNIWIFPAYAPPKNNKTKTPLATRRDPVNPAINLLFVA